MLHNFSAGTRTANVANAVDDAELTEAAKSAADAARIVNAMSVDVEDYYQVSAFAKHVAPNQWDTFEGRVEQSTQRTLALFADHGVKATFFTLGWVAKRYPSLVRTIVAEGHELASHGMQHVRVHEQTPAVFRADIGESKRLLEDVGGCAVRGYRAASFSITEQTRWAFDVLAEEGYAYSSSVYPIRHDHYGIPGAPRFAYRPGTQDLVEVPVSTVAVFGQALPCGGGGYFRLLPYRLSRWAIRRVNRRDGRPCIFYFHPWEIDPEQPRMQGLTLRTRFRHYTNLSRMERRLAAVLKEFEWGRMDRIFLTHPVHPRPEMQ